MPPIVAAAVALVMAFRRAPPVAYVAGSQGTLIGADLLNLERIAALGAPVVSIGGAGTFDGVFLTGVIAGLLACTEGGPFLRRQRLLPAGPAAEWTSPRTPVYRKVRPGG